MSDEKIAAFRDYKGGGGRRLMQKLRENIIFELFRRIVLLDLLVKCQEAFFDRWWSKIEGDLEFERDIVARQLLYMIIINLNFNYSLIIIDIVVSKLYVYQFSLHLINSF